jgi:long-chain acyl-CoA synthetase
MLNLAVILEDTARRYPRNKAFTLGNTTLTYGEVDAWANRIAGGLRRLGVRPGEKVALCAPNILEFPVVYYGILKAGAVVVPINVLLQSREFAYYLTDSEARIFICFEGSPESPLWTKARDAFDQVESCTDFIVIRPSLLQGAGPSGVMTLEELIAGCPDTFEYHPAGADDTAVIVYTSGTTGKGKGAELTHSNLFTNAVLSSDILQSSRHDVQLAVLPLFHIFGMTVMMNAGIYRGLHSVLMTRFDAVSVFRLFIRHEISIFAGVPTMYWGLLNCPDTQDIDKTQTGKLRICVSGGSALPVEMLRQFEKKFEVPILEGYGMSEGSPVVTFNQLDTGRKPGSIGTPVWGVEVKVVNENGSEVPRGEKGELIYRGPNVMKGYFKGSDLAALALRDGWLHSGDVAIMDEDGFLFIVDRIKDIIIRGGVNVYPREIEEVMMQHPAVSMVSVVGVCHEKWGEEIKAFVVLKAGMELCEEELIAWTRQRVAAYKFPRLVQFVVTLPMNAAGKILKKALKVLT